VITSIFFLNYDSFLKFSISHVRLNI